MSEGINKHPKAHWNPMFRPSVFDEGRSDSGSVLPGTNATSEDRNLDASNEITSNLANLNLGNGTKDAIHDFSESKDDRRPISTSESAEAGIAGEPINTDHELVLEQDNFASETVEGTDTFEIQYAVAEVVEEVGFPELDVNSSEIGHVTGQASVEEESFFDKLGASENPEPEPEPEAEAEPEVIEPLPYAASQALPASDLSPSKHTTNKRISVLDIEAGDDSFFDQLADEKMDTIGEDSTVNGARDLGDEPVRENSPEQSNWTDENVGNSDFFSTLDAQPEEVVDLDAVPEIEQEIKHEHEHSGDLSESGVFDGGDATLFDELAAQSEQDHSLLGGTDANDSVLITKKEEKDIIEEGSTSRPALEAAFSFLEEDDDLLPDDDYLEEEPSASIAGSSEEIIASPSAYTGNGSPYMPGSTSVGSKRASTSYVTQATKNNAFDLPSNIIPKSTVRSYSSMQNLNNRPSPYAPVVNSTSSIYSSPHGSADPPPPPLSVVSPTNNSGAPVSSKTTKSKKSFFEDLPLPTSRRAVSRQASMQSMNGGGATSISQFGGQSPNILPTGPHFGQQPGPPMGPPTGHPMGPPAGPSMGHTIGQPPPPPVSVAPPKNPYGPQSSIASPSNAYSRPVSVAPPKNPYSPQSSIASPNNAYSRPVNAVSPNNAYIQPANVVSPNNAYSRPANVVSPSNAYIQPANVVSPNNAYGRPANAALPDVSGQVPNMNSSGYSHSRTPSVTDSYRNLPPTLNETNSSYASKNSNMPSQPYQNAHVGQAPTNPYAPVSQSGYGKDQARPAEIYKTFASPVAPGSMLPPRDTQAQSGAATLGDLPMDLSRTVETVNRLPGRVHGHPYSYSHANAPPNVAAPVQEALTQSNVHVDNEALLHRQFPVFSWGHSGKVVYLIPPAMNYGSSAPLGCDIKVENGQTVHGTEESVSLLLKFPGPLFTTKGAIKSKKKELEKWVEEKIALLEKDSSTLPDRLLLWKFVALLLQTDGPTFNISALSSEKLKEIAILVNPRVAADMEARKEHEPNPVSNGTLVNSSADPGHQRRHSSFDQGYYGSAGAIGSGIPGSMNASGTNKAYREDLQTIYSDLSVGERQSALNYCLDRRLWAHALVIASSLDEESWHGTVAEFVRESIESVGTVHSRSLSLMYRYFGGVGANSVAALYPPRTMSANLAQTEDREKVLVENLRDWYKYLSFMLLNTSSKMQDALLGLGRMLLERGFIDASHICFILSGASLFGAPEEEGGINLLGSDSRYSRAGVGRDIDSIVLSEIYEFIILNSSLTPSPSFSPHLSLYKAQHGIILADYGYFVEGQKYVDNALSIAKATKASLPSGLLERLESASRWLSSINDSSNAGWFGSKLGRTKLDQTLMKSFNKFVAGEEEQQPSGPVISPDGAIFRNLASTPIAQGSASTSNSTDTTPFGDYRSNPYAPVEPPSQTANKGLNRVQSANYIFPDHHAAPTLNRSQTAGTAAALNATSYDTVSAQNFSADSASGRSSVVSFSPAYSEPQLASGGSYAFAGSQNGVLSRPSSSQQARMSPYAVEGSLQKSASPHSSLQPSPRPQSSEPVLADMETPYNPYNPGANRRSQTIKASAPNPYAPVSASGSSNNIAPDSSYTPSASHVKSESVQSANDGETPVSSMFGYNPYSTAPASESTASATFQNDYNPKPETSQDQTSDATYSNSDAGRDSYDPDAHSYGANYDSTIFNDRSPYIDEELSNADGVEENDAGTGGTGYHTPVSAPMPPLTSKYAPPHEDHRDIEDYGTANAKPAKDSESDSKKKSNKTKEDADNKDEKKGWFSWLRKNHPDEPKVVRAKLGEESSFYYDENLKRWVNKKAPPSEEQKSTAPPPPPKTGSAPKSNTSGPPSGPPSGTAGSPGLGAPPPPPSNSGPSLPSSKPKTSIGGDLDDLLAAAPPGGSMRRGGRKNARSRYVDIMANKE